MKCSLKKYIIRSYEDQDIPRMFFNISQSERWKGVAHVFDWCNSFALLVFWNNMHLTKWKIYSKRQLWLAFCDNKFGVQRARHFLGRSDNYCIWITQTNRNSLVAKIVALRLSRFWWKNVEILLVTISILKI